MTSRPVVSVVLIFLNAERFIQEAIESVLAQSFERWELLLVDDGSTDGSPAIAAEYSRRHPGRVRTVQHPGGVNRGMSASRNLGIAAGRGDYVALLDADDVWLPQKLQRQVEIMEGHPDVALVFGSAQYWHGWTGDPADAARDHVPALGIEPGVHAPPSLAVQLHPLGPGTAPCPSDLLWRRAAVQPLGAFEESFLGPNQLFEDQAFLAKVYLHAPVFASTETWIRYRIHPDSCSSAADRSGSYATVRRFYLSWLEGYLRARAVTFPAVWTALRRAERGDVGGLSAKPGGWHLRTAGGSVARLIVQGDSTVRVEIGSVSGTSYDVQANLPDFRLDAGRRYGIRVEARADAPRPALIGLAEAHAPWQGLGWFSHVSLGPEWQVFEGDVTMARDEPNARIHVDLGDAAVSAELRGVTLRRLPEGTLVKPSDPAEASSALLGELRRLTPLSRTWGFDRGQPIDRYYVDAFLARHAADIRGRVLEIEDNTYTRRFGGDRVEASDILHVQAGHPKATLIGDLSDAPHLPAEAFDAIVLTQTLQFIFDTRAALRTLWRMLRPGGVLLATFPGLSKVSRDEWADSWFWAFTTTSARKLFEAEFGAGAVSVDTYGNVLTAIGFLHGLAAEELRPDELDFQDSEYQVLIAVRAVKAPARP